MQGLSNFNTTANSPYSAGPPFPALAAENGLSVDPVTGRIVLGEDLFSGSGLANLLSPREIPFNGNQLWMTDVPGNFGMQFASGGVVAIDLLNAARAEFHADPANGGFIAVDSDSVLANPPRVSLNDISTIPNNNATLRQLSTEFAIRATSGTVNMMTLDQFFGVYRFGDIDGLISGTHLFIDAGPATAEIRNALTGEYMLQCNFAAGTNLLGDINNITTGAKELIDVPNSIHDFSDTLLTARYSINGNPGVSGTFTPPLSITVEGGIITAIS